VYRLLSTAVNYWCSLSIENNLAVKKVGHTDEVEGVCDDGFVCAIWNLGFSKEVMKQDWTFLKFLC